MSEAPSVAAKTAAVTAADATENRIQMRESTYFWHIDDDAEVARRYVREMYPATRARVVSTLVMPRLNDRSHIILVVRKKPTPMNVFAIENSRRLQVPLEAGTKLKEVFESPPVAVKPFISGGNEWEDGALDALGIINACGQYFSPGVVHYKEADGGKAHLRGA